MMPAWCGDGPFGGLLQSATNVTGIFCLPHEEAIVVFMPTTKVLPMLCTYTPTRLFP